MDPIPLSPHFAVSLPALCACVLATRGRPEHSCIFDNYLYTGHVDISGPHLFNEMGFQHNFSPVAAQTHLIFTSRVTLCEYLRVQDILSSEPERCEQTRQKCLRIPLVTGF